MGVKMKISLLILLGSVQIISSQIPLANSTFEDETSTIASDMEVLNETTTEMYPTGDDENLEMTEISVPTLPALADYDARTETPTTTDSPPFANEVRAETTIMPNIDDTLGSELAESAQVNSQAEPLSSEMSSLTPETTTVRNMEIETSTASSNINPDISTAEAITFVTESDVPLINISPNATTAELDFPPILSTSTAVPEENIISDSETINIGQGIMPSTTTTELPSSSTASSPIQEDLSPSIPDVVGQSQEDSSSQEYEEDEDLSEESEAVPLSTTAPYSTTTTPEPRTMPASVLPPPPPPTILTTQKPTRAYPVHFSPAFSSRHHSPYNSTCRLTFDCEGNLQCRYGLCLCPPLQAFDALAQKCVIPIGEECNSDLPDHLTNCPPSAECFMDRCVCQPGYSMYTMTLCKSSYGRREILSASNSQPQVDYHTSRYQPNFSKNYRNRGRDVPDHKPSLVLPNPTPRPTRPRTCTSSNCDASKGLQCQRDGSCKCQQTTNLFIDEFDQCLSPRAQRSLKDAIGLLSNSKDDVKSFIKLLRRFEDQNAAGSEISESYTRPIHQLIQLYNSEEPSSDRSQIRRRADYGVPEKALRIDPTADSAEHSSSLKGFINNKYSRGSEEAAKDSPSWFKVDQKGINSPHHFHIPLQGQAQAAEPTIVERNAPAIFGNDHGHSGGGHGIGHPFQGFGSLPMMGGHSGGGHGGGHGHGHDQHGHKTITGDIADVLGKSFNIFDRLLPLVYVMHDSLKKELDRRHMSHGGSHGGMGGMSHGEMGGMSHGGMSGMSHGGMGGMSHGGMGGMSHGGMGGMSHGGMGGMSHGHDGMGGMSHGGMGGMGMGGHGLGGGMGGHGIRGMGGHGMGAMGGHGMGSMGGHGMGGFGGMGGHGMAPMGGIGGMGMPGGHGHGMDHGIGHGMRAYRDVRRSDELLKDGEFLGTFAKVMGLVAHVKRKLDLGGASDALKTLVG